jgi:DNA repair exonuclease SbcCD ATPase subunit
MSDHASTLDEIAEGLYTMHPDGFAAARDDQVKQARIAGQRELARALGELRKPTLSAWMVNILWRNQRDTMQQLFELADALAAAQASASGEALRALIGHRRQFESALLRTAELLAKGAGVNVTTSMSREVQETLAAALASPAAADEVRTGRLVKPLAPNAFDGVVAPSPSAAPRPPMPPPTPIRRPMPQPAAGTPEPGRSDEGAARKQAEAEALRRKQAEEEAHRRRRAEEEAERVRAEAAARAAREREEAARRERAARRVREAKENVEAAAEALADDERAAESANDLLQALLKRTARLRDQLRELEDETAAAETTANAAGRSRERSEQAHLAALEALADAQRGLEDSSALPSS